MNALTQIQTFLEVAQTGSFADAARRLSLPRSTVSARVRTLEDRLNVRLLHRTTRRVTLTDEGRRYMAHCQAAIDALLAAEAALARTDVLSGTIRITVPVDMSKTWLAETLGAFTDRHPAVHIDVLATDETLDLIANNIDLALRGGAPGNAGLVARKLGEGVLAFYASPVYVNRRLDGPNLPSIAGHVLFDPTGQCKGAVGAGALRGAVDTGNFELAKALAQRSRGIVLLPTSVCANEVAAGTLVRLRFDQPLPPLPLYAVMPTRMHRPARVQAFVDFLTANLPTH